MGKYGTFENRIGCLFQNSLTEDVFRRWRRCVENCKSEAHNLLIPKAVLIFRYRNSTIGATYEVVFIPLQYL